MGTGTLVVRDVVLLDTATGTRTETSLRIEDGIICQISPELPQADRELDGRGRLTTAGLIDAHFHAYAISLEGDESERVPLSYVALLAQHRLGDALHRGFTTVRDPAGGDAGLARAIAEGHILAPRYLHMGAALSQTGGHGDCRAHDDESLVHDGRSCEVVDGVEAVRLAARERFRGGAHAIKIMASGGVISPTDPIRVPQYSRAEIAAVVDEAGRRGSYVAAHAYSPEAIAHAVLAGVRSIEHGNLLDGPTAALMAEHGAVLVPTLGAYEAMARLGRSLGLSESSQEKNQVVLKAGAEAVRLALAAGVVVGFGSDNMGELVSEQLVGIRLMAEATSPLGALHAATVGNAAVLQRPDLGVVAVGSPADLVLWSGDPIADVDVVADGNRPRTVVLGGRVVHDVDR